MLDFFALLAGGLAAIVLLIGFLADIWDRTDPKKHAPAIEAGDKYGALPVQYGKRGGRYYERTSKQSGLTYRQYH